jgi:hypothetical protein
MLHITNGDCTVQLLRRAGIAGELLPWRDVLHEGPVPAQLDLTALSAVRARYIVDCGWGTAAQVRADFAARDAQLAGCADHAEVVLWFEHDLYDQLQLLQLLHWFAARPSPPTRLTLICVDQYLGDLSPERLSSLFPTRVPVSAAQLRLGAAAWDAYRANDPQDWVALLDADTTALPFLAGAVRRHLEQYPCVENGTHRSEAQILRALRSGVRTPHALFAAHQSAEERRYLGDSVFWRYLAHLTTGPAPLLAVEGGRPFLSGTGAPYSAEFNEQHLTLTTAGAQVLDNTADWIALNGIDRWLGGVHLRSRHVWRWNRWLNQLERTHD